MEAAEYAEGGNGTNVFDDFLQVSMGEVEVDVERLGISDSERR